MMDLVLHSNFTDSEPRVLDTDLGERLGMTRPTNLRTQVIVTHREELEDYGPLCTAPVQTGGRPAKAFYLNEEQALLVSTLSRAPRAAEARRMLIKVFMAYRRGQLVPTLPDFNNPVLAARAWADEVEQKQIALAKYESAEADVRRLEPMAKAVGMREHLVHQFARTLPGVNCMATKSDLEREGYLYHTRKGYRVHFNYRGKLFYERHHPEHGTVEIFATAAGKEVIASLYRDGKLTMLKGKLLTA